MNQESLRRLAEGRIKDAEALLAASRWAFAYYVAGYAVECGLKSCVLSRMIYTGWVFRDPGDLVYKRLKGTNKEIDYRVHDLPQLLELAGLDRISQEDFRRDPELKRNWGEVAKWSPLSRYAEKGESDAVDLLAAIIDPAHGVYAWLQTHW